MRQTCLSMLLAAAMLPASFAYAQSTDDSATAEQTPPAAEAETPAGPQVGQTYIADVSGDWELRCVKAPEGQPDPCNIYQLLLNDQGQAIVEVTIVPLAPGGQAVAGATIVAPLETLLTQQLTLSVDSANPRVYPFRFCNAGGCVAQIGLTAADVDAFKRGNVAQLRVVPAADPSTEFLLEMSLTGFTNAYETLAGL